MIERLVGWIAGDGGIIETVADKVAMDAGKKAELKAEAARQVRQMGRERLQARAGVIEAEAASEHKLAAVWRPTLMLVFVAIIANNYIVAPYVALIAGQDVTLPIPADLWSLIKIGVGGYIGGRSAEKVMREFKGKRE